MAPIVIEDKAAFEKALADAGDKLVVVDFHAQWCGPCKNIAPLVVELSEQNANVVFLKVDVDEAEDLAQEKDIKAMPTFQFYKSGKLVDEFKGASQEKLKEKVAQLQ